MSCNLLEFYNLMTLARKRATMTMTMIIKNTKDRRMVRWQSFLRRCLCRTPTMLVSYLASLMMVLVEPVVLPLPLLSDVLSVFSLSWDTLLLGKGSWRYDALSIWASSILLKPLPAPVAGTLSLVALLLFPSYPKISFLTKSVLQWLVVLLFLTVKGWLVSSFVMKLYFPVTNCFSQNMVSFTLCW